MKKSLLLITLLIATISLYAATPPYTVSNINQKSHISGPKLKESDLVGKVIYVETWGINCPPCIRSLPHMEKLYQEYKKTGKFILIGAHFQGLNEDAIKKVLKDNGVTYPVYQQAVLGKPKLPSYIPFSYIIDHTGKILWSGSPSSNVDKILKDAIKAAPASGAGTLIGGIEVKYNKSFARNLVVGKNIDTNIKRLTALAAKDDPKGKEAAALVKSCNDWLTAEKTRINQLKETAPAHTLIAINQLFKTSPAAGAEFKDIHKKLQADQNVRRLMQLLQNADRCMTTEYKTKGRKRQAATTTKNLIRQLKLMDTCPDPKIVAEAKQLITTLETFSTSL